MKARSIILIAIALGCGAVASIGISQVIGRGGTARVEKVETVKILVAMNDLDINSELTSDNLSLEEWPKKLAPMDALTEWIEVKEKYTRTRVVKGQPIVKGMLTASMGGKEVIPDDYRVIPIRVSDDVVSGFVLPGDRVDVLVILRAGGEVKLPTAKTVLENVRIFAVNDSIEREVTDGQTLNVRTVSVLVKPKQVELLSLASELGKLRLSLRNPHAKTSNVALGMTDSNALLGRASESASETPPQRSNGDVGPGSGSKSFDQFVRENGGASAAVAAVPTRTPLHVMTMHTPGGVVKYTWYDDNELPEVVDMGQGAAPMAAAVPQPLPPVGPEADNDKSQSDSEESKADSNDDKSEEDGNPAEESDRDV